MCKKKKNFFRGIVVFYLIVFITIASYTVISKYIAKFAHINLNELNITLYIETADEASDGKGQVNWKYLAAIDGVRYRNNLSDIRKESINNLANMFIKEDDDKYKLRKLEEVLDDLEIVNGKREKVYTYLEDLKYIGPIGDRLYEDSPYLKFIDDLTIQAVASYEKYGIFPSVMIAQAILESGWGNSELSTIGNNLFGIKADLSWKGEKIALNTKEYYNDEIVANFRKYSSKGESLKDYGEFLYNNPRYRKNGVFKASYYIEQAQALQDAGYSTKTDANGEKSYARSLIQLIRQYNLQLIDNKVLMNG